jgi:hypothetical protein
MTDTYPYRDMRFFKDETKADHAKRMRKAALYGNHEKVEPLHTMIAEVLVAKDATKFATLLHQLGMVFRETKGVGENSFFIEYQ